MTNNMGAVEKADVEKFADWVFREEGLRITGWAFLWTDAVPGICLRSSRQILIPKNMIGRYPWEAKEYALHEIAHIETEDDKVHGTRFYREYARLVLQFLAREQP